MSDTTAFGGFRTLSLVEAAARAQARLHFVFSRGDPGPALLIAFGAGLSYASQVVSLPGVPVTA